jgi:diamine N-acetyltransferase
MNLLSDNTIRLRALEPEDLDLLFSVENNPEFWEVSSTQTPFSRALLKKYIDNAFMDLYEAKQLRLVITERESGTAMGIVDLFNYEPMHQRAGVGVLILDQYRNKGIAKQALKLFIEYAFTHLELHQLYANILSDNVKSMRLFESLNFEKIGRKKDWIKFDGTFKNVELYQLIDQK